MLSLQTKPAPPSLFQVDGVAYQMLGLDLIPEDVENQVTALFARHWLQPPAERHKTRSVILCKLTDMPYDVAVRLSPEQQAQLLEAMEVTDA